MTWSASGSNSYLPVVLNGNIHVFPPLVGQHEAVGLTDPAEEKVLEGKSWTYIFRQSWKSSFLLLSRSYKFSGGDLAEKCAFYNTFEVATKLRKLPSKKNYIGFSYI